ncbi:MAG: aldehyde dehydrogenase family protein [Nanopusillaceae archaeon]
MKENISTLINNIKEIKSYVLKKLKKSSIKNKLIKLSVKSFPTPIKYHLSDYQYLINFVSNLEKQIKYQRNFIYYPIGRILFGLPGNEPLVTNTTPIISALVSNNEILAKPSKRTKKFFQTFKKLFPSKYRKKIIVLDSEKFKKKIEFYLSMVDYVYWMGGRKSFDVIYNICAKLSKPCDFDVEGNDIALIWKIKRFNFIRGLVKSIAYHDGKRCQTPRIIIISKEQKESFLKKFITEIEKLKKGDIWDINTDISQDIKINIVKRKKELISCLKNPFYGPTVNIYFSEDMNEIINLINSSLYRISLYLYSNMEEKEIRELIQKIKPFGRILFNFNLEKEDVSPLDPWGGYGLSGCDVDFWINRFTYKVYIKT